MNTKNTLLIIFSLLSNFLFAHDINYKKIILKRWTIEKENKTIDGSFYMLKNETVYIEDANSNVVACLLSSLSKEDQTFALHKNEWVKQLNNQQLADANQPVQIQSIFNYQLWLVIALLVALSVFIFSFTEKKKLKYLVPVLFVGVSMILYSFTQKALQSMQSMTSPTFIDSAFVPFKPNVHTFWDTTYFYVESKGIPTTHGMMVGISNHGWQQQVPLPHCYIGSQAWSIPLHPIMATTPVPVSAAHFTKGAIAIAVNGIPIFNPFTNTGVDAFLDGQLDNYGGHCGRGDDYHYHTAPLHLFGFTTSTLPIAYGLDGFAVYGGVEPDGTTMQTLDANHGHLFNGVYHYHGSATAPYMIGNMVGMVTEDANKQIIPQPQGQPIRTRNWTPLNGALITACATNATNNGYNLSYTLNGTAGYATNYSWSGTTYTFIYVTPSCTTTTTYNGPAQCSIPTAIDNIIVKENKILIYPNPANEILNINLGNDNLEKDVRQIAIYDLKGGLVLKKENFHSTLDIKQLSSGTYLVKIQFLDAVVSKKIRVQ